LFVSEARDGTGAGVDRAWEVGARLHGTERGVKLPKKLREAVASFVEVEVERQLAIGRTSPTFSVLTIRFENRAVDIPYQPWSPRASVTLPGRWVQDTDTEPVQ
jgi:hypothetical protein